MCNYLYCTGHCTVGTKFVKAVDLPLSLLSCLLRGSFKKKSFLIHSVFFMLKLWNSGHTCEFTFISQIQFTKRNKTSAIERPALVFQLHRRFTKWGRHLWTSTLVPFIFYKSMVWHCFCLLVWLGREGSTIEFHCSAWDTIRTTEVTAKTL